MSATKSAWGKCSESVDVSFSDVMSEELAMKIQLEETGAVDIPRVQTSDYIDCENDELVAKMLQLEFDKEHDTLLKREEKKCNGMSKVSVSYENYRIVPDSASPTVYGSDSSDDDSCDWLNRDWDSFESSSKESPVIPRCGYAKNKDGKITTKHDITITQRKNAQRMMEFPPGIKTGDGGGFDMQINNKVYNKLKTHSMQEERRRHRVHDKSEKATAEMAVDPRTRLILYKLINNGVLEAVNGVVSTGKEALVLHAVGGCIEDTPLPKNCAVKVFKTTLNEFKNRDRYIKDDHRFMDRFSKQNPRKIIHLWAEKEMRNLTRIRSAQINCPTVVVLKKHVLVMEFIGTDCRPAPKLKDVKLSREGYSQCYDDVVQIMKDLYEKAELIHADLSEFNLLYHNEKLYVIDVSQSMLLHTPQSHQFLYRDCCNVTHFFSSKNVPNVVSPEELYEAVCGKQAVKDGIDCTEGEKFEKNEELLTYGLTDDGYDFDYHWEKAQNNRIEQEKKKSVGLSEGTGDSVCTEE